MLHIFSGAPKSADVSAVIPNEVSKPIWRTYQYKTSDLDTLSDSYSVTDLQYGYNEPQFSNIDAVGEGANIQNNEDDLIHSYVENVSDDDSRTTTDDLYREVYVESQCLLNSGTTSTCLVGSSKVTSPLRYYDCKHRVDIDLHCSGNDVNNHEQSQKVQTETTCKRRKTLHVDDKSIGPICDSIDIVQETPPDIINQPGSCCFLLNPTTSSSSLTDDNPCGTCGNDLLQNKDTVKFVSIQDAIKVKKLSNICIVVLQTFPLKKIVIKQGINIGETVDMASVLVGDRSKFYFQISLWRECASWIDRIYVGDVLLLTDISFQIFRDEVVGRTSKCSQVYNLHHPVYPYPDNWRTILCLRRLHSFVKWIKQNHNYLNSPILQNTTSVINIFTNISSERLNDIQARLNNISIQSGKLEQYNYFSVKLPKVTLELQDQKGLLMNLFLWGEQYKYVEELKRNIHRVLDVTSVIQKVEANTGIHSLHSTSKSMITFKESFDENFVSFLCTIDHFQFETDSQSKIYLSSDNIQQFEDLKAILYRGCKTCYTQLYRDSNDVYNECHRCNKSEVDYCFSKFHMSIKTVKEDRTDNSSNMMSAIPRSSLYGEGDNCLEIIVYPDKADKLFPLFVASKTSKKDMDTSILKDEIDSLLAGKTFDFILKKVEVDMEQMSCFNRDLYEMIDFIPV